MEPGATSKNLRQHFVQCGMLPIYMSDKIINLEVAAGWLQYCGLKAVHPYCLNQKNSTSLHEMAGEWVTQGSAGMEGRLPIRVEDGDCYNHAGNFVGRFLVVELDEFWGGGGFAVAAMIRDDGGDRKAGAALLATRKQVKLLCEDIGRGFSLPRAQRRKGVLAAMDKWESTNPKSWNSPYKRKPPLFARTRGRIAAAWKKVLIPFSS